MRRTDTSKLTDAMFIVWWNKAVHHSMSHVRQVATCPERKVARCKREPPTETAASGLASGASAAEQRAEMATSGGDVEQRAQPPAEMATTGASAGVEQRLARIEGASSATSGARDAATEVATSGANADVEQAAIQDRDRAVGHVEEPVMRSNGSVFSEALDDKPASDVHTPPRKDGQIR